MDFNETAEHGMLREAVRKIGLDFGHEYYVEKSKTDGRMSELWASLNADPEMKELAAKSGFELIDVGIDKMDAFMKDKIRVYTDAGKRMGLGK